jgi:hypothetical protein
MNQAQRPLMVPVLEWRAWGDGDPHAEDVCRGDGLEDALAETRVLPNILSITSVHPERTIFTRFIPAVKAGQGVGMWRHYYKRWSSMTIHQLGPDMIELVPELAGFVPPARTFDKPVLLPFIGN